MGDDVGGLSGGDASGGSGAGGASSLSSHESFSRAVAASDPCRGPDNNNPGPSNDGGPEVQPQKISCKTFGNGRNMND